MNSLDQSSLLNGGDIRISPNLEEIRAETELHPTFMNSNLRFLPPSLLDTLADLASVTSPIKQSYSNRLPSMDPLDPSIAQMPVMGQYGIAGRRQRAFSESWISTNAWQPKSVSTGLLGLDLADAELVQRLTSFAPSSDSNAAVGESVGLGQDMSLAIGAESGVLLSAADRLTPTVSAPFIACEDPEGGSILPHMLEKYASIYNKNGRIGIYTRQERSDIINRFREKKRRRVWKKKVRYFCRKNLADRRVRVKGRFVRLPSSSTEGGTEGEDLHLHDDGASDAQVDTRNPTRDLRDSPGKEQQTVKIERSSSPSSLPWEYQQGLTTHSYAPHNPGRPPAFGRDALFSPTLKLPPISLIESKVSLGLANLPSAPPDKLGLSRSDASLEAVAASSIATEPLAALTTTSCMTGGEECCDEDRQSRIGTASSSPEGYVGSDDSDMRDLSEADGRPPVPKKMRRHSIAY